MSSLQEQIRSDMTAAMKAREKERTGALRMLLAALQLEATNGSKHELSDDDVLKIIAREIKKRKESAQVYADAGRQELADQELFEASVLSEYQPQQLEDAEVEALVAEVVEQFRAEQGEATMKNMGQIMKLVTEKAAGRADGKRLSTAVRGALN